MIAPKIIMARILIETYGCTLNQADSRIMGSILEKSGHSVEYGTYTKASAGSYDFVIINTCTVKTPTEQKILNKIKSASNLGTRLIIAGCLASASPEAVERAAPNSSIINTRSLTKIASAIDIAASNKRALFEDKSLFDKMLFYEPTNSAIAKIPVSEGCLSSCAFCETKFARGPLNSFSEELILKAAAASVTRGAKELEITAQDTGAYGLDKKTNIAELLGKIVQVEGDFMIRLGMLNPEHLHRYFDALIDVYRNKKMYKFIHLPVQSGSNKVLKEMKRNYTVEEFMQYVKELRNKVKGISVETDMIVGYPTETQEDFEESLELIRSTKPEVTNVSKFGARPHAEASKLPQLANTEIKRRSIEMSRLVRIVQSEARQRFVGTKQEVLITEQNERSITGRTESYISVALAKPGAGDAAGLLGSRMTVDIIDSTSACLIAHTKEF
ncbi:MAG: tRNA (N(6)-L-threonylcarbamoyladenosine(37)-C(2))-methylthiotransferase [Candidatus Micrarchaeia archaeon]